MFRSRSDLFDYQEEAATRMAHYRRMACFLEPGMGKTAITLTALKDMGVPKTLVVAPARVAETVWHAEVEKWWHLKGMKVVPIVGNIALRRRLLAEGFDVGVISYENLSWLLDNIDLRSTFKAVVFDELSKMKHPGTTRFRRMRKVIRSIDIRFGLTGTPVGNHLLDIWGEMYMVADEAPLGPTFGDFCVQYFLPGAKVNNVVVSWKPRPGAQEAIHKRIKPYAFTLKPTNAPPLPALVSNIVNVALPQEVEEMAATLASELTVKLESGTDLYAFSSTTAAMKARQMVGGAVYVEGERWEHVHDAKLQALTDLVDELQGQPVLVFYWFRHEATRILGQLGLRARELRDAADIDAWNRGEVEVLLAHPASAGHGLNLQHGGHNICWYTLPWSLEMFKQARGRLVRHGQKNPLVMEHVLLAGKLDKVVLQALGRKDATESALLEATRL